MVRVLSEDVHKLRPQAHHHIELTAGRDFLVQLHLVLAEIIVAHRALHAELLPVEERLGVDEVDPGVSDEIGGLKVDGVGVNLKWCLEQRDTGAHGQGLDLVVRDVDDGGPGLLVKPLELGPHVDSEPCVQVGQRLVQEEELGA